MDIGNSIGSFISDILEDDDVSPELKTKINELESLNGEISEKDKRCFDLSIDDSDTDSEERQLQTEISELKSKIEILQKEIEGMIIREKVEKGVKKIFGKIEQYQPLVKKIVFEDMDSALSLINDLIEIATETNVKTWEARKAFIKIHAEHLHSQFVLFKDAGFNHAEAFELVLKREVASIQTLKNLAQMKPGNSSRSNS